MPTTILTIRVPEALAAAVRRAAQRAGKLPSVYLRDEIAEIVEPKSQRERGIGKGATANGLPEAAPEVVERSERWRPAAAREGD